MAMNRNSEGENAGSALQALPDHLVLDGAVSTRLEDLLGSTALASALWSAPYLQSHPELITSIHREYYLAGANVVTTASYQAAPLGLAKHLGLSPDESASLIAKSVAVAEAARKEAKARLVAAGASEPVLLIAGSIGPYGAYLADGSEYRGNYELPPSQLQDFHRARIAALLDAGADLLALETFPNWREAKAVLDLLASEFPQARCWLSFTTRPGEPGRIADGTRWDQILPELEGNEQVAAVGVNCISPADVTEALGHMVPSTTHRVIVYPNSGESWDAERRRWETSNAATIDAWDQSARKWLALGASWVGGCCRTTPDHIRTVRKVVDAVQEKP